MENVIKKLLVAMLLCLMQTAVCTADTFKGKIVNAETGEILIGATVRSEINPQPGWSMQNSTETDSTGCFTLDSEWEGRIMITFSMIGYKNSRKVDYAYGSEVKDTTDLGTIRLQPTALMLQEVEVKAKVPRITMRGDTIVFNPEAFKLKEGARLDELIKKLPGVQRRDGKLYWNDKPIRLMMNGKDMFGGDQILEQLPADVADKLKVYDRKSELARHTGNDDGNEDHVLDIQVKPGFLDKWYGDIEAQYQTKKRYSGAITASRLSDQDPHMIYAQANNANRYVDKTIGSTSNRNIDGDGKSQYGSYNYQHNWQTKGTQQYTSNRFNISANMGHSDGWNSGKASTETFFPNQEHTFGVKDTYRYKHNLKPQLEAKLFAYTDSANTIDVKVKASYEKSRKSYEEKSASYGYQPDQFAYHSLKEALDAKPGDALYDRLITRDSEYESTELQQRGLNISYIWQHFIGKKGSFMLGGYTNLSGTNEDTHTNHDVEYLREQRNEKLWQFYDRSEHNLNTQFGASFDYWLGKKVYFNIFDNVRLSRTRTERNFFSDTDEQTDAQMDERADREVDHHAGEGADDYADVQMELQSREGQLPLRTARHHSRAHKQHVRAVYLPEVEDEPRAQHGHCLRIQHLRARPREHARLPQHHRPAAYIHGQPAAAQLAQSYHYVQLPPHVAAQADCAGLDRFVQQGHQPRGYALQLQLGYRRLHV